MGAEARFHPIHNRPPLTKERTTVIAKEVEPSRVGEKKVVDLMEALRKGVTGKMSEEKAPVAKKRKMAG